VAGVWAFYDLAFQPPSTAAAPIYTKTQIEIPRDQTLTTLSVDAVKLPDAAYVHGAITDPTGLTVAGAQLSVYQIVTDTTLCTQLNRSPDQCVIPAILAGHGTADMSGTAALTLARP
jgi:hypothetical protein